MLDTSANAASVCPQCGEKNEHDTDTCHACGAPLVFRCPTCGKAYPAGTTTCADCKGRETDGGTPAAFISAAESSDGMLRLLMPRSLADKINALKKQIAGEHREITVMAVRLDHASAGERDSEAVHLATDEAIRALAGIAYEYEGTIDKVAGDGLLILFGAPVAHENDPERAVLAALAMHRAIQSLVARCQQQYGIEIGISISINSGQAIVGDIDNELQMEYVVIGDTVNETYHMLEYASPGSTLVGFETYHLTNRSIEYRVVQPQGYVSRQGDQELLYVPLGRRDGQAQPRGIPDLQAPMIGRGEPLARLREMINEVEQSGESRIAYISGEAGVGKSRLVAELEKAEHRPDLFFFHGACQALSRSASLALFRSLLRDMFGISESDPAARQMQAVRAYALAHGLSEQGDVLYLANILGLDEKGAGYETSLALIDDSLIHRLIRSVLLRVVLAQAGKGITVLVLDDLHWIDQASSEFLSFLIQSTNTIPVAFILISRHMERDAAAPPLVEIPAWQRRNLLEIYLQPLSVQDGKLLVDQLVLATGEPAESLKQNIAVRSEGNPFYAEEIVRLLIDRRGLVRDGDSWTVTPAAETLLREVPRTLKALILTRYDELPDSQRKLLQMASIIGSSFSQEVVTVIYGEEPRVTADRLRQLSAQQFLVPFEAGPGTYYRFRHALIQETIYQTLLKKDRQRMHDRVADVLEKDVIWFTEGRDEALAYHYSRGTRPDKAIPFLMSIARNALRRGGPEIAARHYRHALDLMPGAVDTDITLLRLRANIGLAQSLKFTGDLKQAGEILEAALPNMLPPGDGTDSAQLLPELINGLKELADIRVRTGSLDQAIMYLQKGLDALGPQAAEAHPYLWRLLVDRLAWVRFRQANLEEAFALANSATLGMREGSPEYPMVQASLYNTLGGVFWQWGDFAKAAEYVGISLGLYEKVQYYWGMAIAYTNLGVLNFAQGNWALASEYYQQAYQLRRDNGYLPELALNLSNIGMLHIAMGEHDLARQDLEQSLEIAERVNDDYGRVMARVGLAHLAVIREQYETAEGLLREVTDIVEAASESQAIHAQWLMALIMASKGDLTTARTTARRALERARAAKLTDMESSCLRVLGVLHKRAGAYLEADTLLREALDICRQMNTPYEQGLVLHEMALLYMENAGAADESGGTVLLAKALSSAEEALAIFSRLGARYDLRAAEETRQKIAAAIADRPSPEKTAPHHPGSVTAPPAARKRGERRPVAIAWAVFTLASHDDPEAEFEMLAHISQAVTVIAAEYKAQAIRRHDGYILVFGAPAAYEDDAVRAVSASRRIVEFLGEPDDRLSGVEVRVAISAGEGVVGKFDAPVTDIVVSGKPLADAQELLEHVPPGSIWVTEAVHAAAEHIHAFDPVQMSAESGLSGRVWEYVGFRDVPRLPRGIPDFTAPLIGRAAVLDQLHDCARQLNDGLGGFIWIEGAPGIGKSRLIREFISGIEVPDALIWSGQALPQMARDAFALFTNLFNNVFSIHPNDSSGEAREKIRQQVASWPAEAEVSLPYLQLLLGLHKDEGGHNRLTYLPPDQLRQQVFVMMRRLLKVLSDRQPLVIVLDDLHWIDATSAELLLFLTPTVVASPILFVCAQRRQGADLPNDRLIRAHSTLPTQAVRIQLERLSDTDSLTLMRELLPHIQFPPSLRAIILERSEGNPYFIEEFVRAMIEQGYVQYVDGQWVFDQDRLQDTIPIPASLTTLIQSRYDALPPDLHTVAQCAAVIGPNFETELVEAICDVPDVRGALNRLKSRLIISQLGEDNQWAFYHSTIQMVIYNAMLQVERRRLHAQIARALEVRWAGAETAHAATLAYHYSGAGESQRALSYLLTAGEQAAAKSANDEALDHFEQAADYITRLPGVTEHDRWRLAIGLGEVYRNAGRYEESIAALNACRELGRTSSLGAVHRGALYRGLGDTALKQSEYEAALAYFAQALDLLAEVDSNEGQAEAARAYLGIAWTHFRQGQLQLAEEACAKGMECARRAEALNELASIENVLGGIFYRQDELNKALHHTTRAMVLREQAGYTWGVASSLNNLGILAVSAGQWSKAASFFQRSLELREEMGDVEGVALAHNNLGMLLRDQGSYEEAELHFRASIEMATRHGMSYHVFNSTTGLAQVLFLKGEVDLAREAVAVAIGMADEIGAKETMSEAHRLKAEILLSESQYAEALQAAEQAVRAAVADGNPGFIAAAWRVMAEIDFAKGSLESAREHIAHAAKALEGDATSLDAGRVAFLTGRLDRAEGKTREADEQFKKARGIFMRLGAAVDLKTLENEMK
ncbi:MAG: hypothetical protein Kow00124_28530 [Anaerolineae bacterium]